MSVISNYLHTQILRNQLFKQLLCVISGAVCLGFFLMISNPFTTPDAPIDSLTIVTDESWEVSKEQPTFGKYPLSMEAVLAAKTDLKGGSAQAVVADIYGQSTLIDAAKPIWLTKKASSDWETRQFKKVFMMRNNVLETARFKINCDDAARVYINGKLLTSGKELTGILKTSTSKSVEFRQLTAYFYDHIFSYDVKSFLIAGALNTIIIEVASEPVARGHAYVCARLDADFVKNTIAIKPTVNEPIKPIKKTPTVVKKPIEKIVAAPKKDIEKPMEAAPKPIEKPVVAESNVFKSSHDLDINRLKIGDIFELGNIYFKADDAQLNSTSQNTLSELAVFLKANNSVKIEIGGHTNLIPTNEYAYKLSSNRAQSVVNYLKQSGVAHNQLTFKGYGRSKPKLMEKTSDANQKNQRVEVTILAK
jgi:outer membrane protein OmpA-like peptidoglycan-associated protein